MLGNPSANQFWYPSGAPAAEQTSMRQEIYGLLLEHPGWLSTASLSAFKTAQDGSFVGESESLKKGWQQLLQDISAHQTVLEPVYAQLDTLADQIQQLSSSSCASASSTNNQPLLDTILLQYNSLVHQLEQADATFFQTVLDSASALLLQNAALDDSLWHTWCEKRYNEIALHWLAGTEPDSSAKNDLRMIAQTCLNEGGRAVLGARGLCEVWLKEHYGEAGCQNAPQGRSAIPERESETLSGLIVQPNPANEVVRLLVNPATMPGARQIQVLNLNGQLVHSGNMPFAATEWRISVHGWPEGMYVLRVMNGTEAHSLTFVVQHR